MRGLNSSLHLLDLLSSSSRVGVIKHLPLLNRTLVHLYLSVRDLLSSDQLQRKSYQHNFSREFFYSSYINNRSVKKDIQQIYTKTSLQLVLYELARLILLLSILDFKK